MFSLFFTGLQQDLKIFLLVPIVCALFRLLFILIFRPKKSPVGEWRKWFTCFRYAFWWGMDINAYAFLVPLLLISLPAAFIPSYFAVSDTVRGIGITLFLCILYTAFVGKLIFYYHFHDIFNHMVRLGGHADKKNLLDIFFRQNHGGWILLGYIPFAALSYTASSALLSTPTIPYLSVENTSLQYALNLLVFLASIALFYWIRYGGTFLHRHKPEWDDIPVLVKDDVFMAKATVDDLIALKLVYKVPFSNALRHSDEESVEILAPLLPASAFAEDKDPLEHFHRTATGAKIKKPSRIFFLFGESHAQSPFDPIYDDLGLMTASKAFRALPSTISIDNFFPAGLNSRPSLAGVISGIYDGEMAINEMQDFWRRAPITALPLQLKALGYKTYFWYGGALNHGSMEHFLPGQGFDRALGGPSFCPKGSPSTWLGVYDHIFLEEAAARIREENDDYAFHFLYTTSNHGPFSLPYESLGFDIDAVMPKRADTFRNEPALWRRFASAWYADQVLCRFIDAMRETYPDSLFLVTGDHSMGIMPFDKGLLARTEPVLREDYLTSFAISHPDLKRDTLAQNTLGSHMHILPTLIDLIAPAGHAYHSIMPPLTERIDTVITPYGYLTSDTIGSYREAYEEDLAPTASLPARHHEIRFTEERDALIELTGYLVRHPELLVKTC
ncbi:LTA synthase family protein [Selenomonas sp. TAMA-11512]|uniref:LTA synthase family protein n=1 Tax=Selenomonas sp. TAMA-11512 TaxID=3095337 RepID=UPI003092C1FD|nr:LTA synthase family protein [Selenomonas sp. TAMA-11512]